MLSMCFFYVIITFVFLLSKAAILCNADASIIDGITDHVKSAENWLSKNEDYHVRRLLDFLRIPSVSSDSLRKQAMLYAAEWLKTELNELGMQNVQILPAGQHPTVFAEWKVTDKSIKTSSSSIPTVLLYAHYDVQPEDPISGWTKTKDPFNPVIIENHIYARGASDDKGHLYTIVAALRAWLTISTQQYPINFKILFEGEEEIGSPGLKDLLAREKDLFKADFAFSADGGMVDENTPSLCVSLRGALALEVNVKVANSDLHSGTYGGGVMNPVIALAYLIASLRDERTGRVLIDGFYDDVRNVSREDLNDIEAHPIPVKDILLPLGINESVGEEGFSFRERTMVRPSLDILGIYGGFSGEGVKTVLPREATAKISSRIVPDQSTHKTVRQIENHILTEAKKFPGIQVTVHNLRFSSEPVHIPKHSKGNTAATAVLRTIYNRDPVYVRFGGSIPALGLLQSELGIETTMFSFALPDEDVHAPDEYARIDQLRRSEIAYVRLFGEIAKRGLSSSKEEL